MAKAETLEATEAPAPPAKKSRKLVIIIGAAVAVLVLALAGVLLLMKGKAAAPEDEEAADSHAAAKSADPPVFVNLEPFTVNLQPENGEQYLQVVAVLKVSEAKVGDEIKVYMPELRHRTLLLLSSKRASEISTPEGREELAEALRAETNDMLGYGKPRRRGQDAGHGKESAADAPVRAVLFTSFIVQ